MVSTVFVWKLGTLCGVQAVRGKCTVIHNFYLGPAWVRAGWPGCIRSDIRSDTANNR